ncbi:LOW QUALITY PROTEIN: uncharacterized protein LOC103191511 [Callorhinchus milii]|uniref:LOW QUALITY PROTEIN: uncharacterized protein LOC103191511 n=1 Tax=Callorhinchus milii TaxID=7868 RepID=UPI001C3F996B|nr:LOW QUALITY PROTEIN: uncharacterized protein LOC103191511 [Callorhinchus milii]
MSTEDQQIVAINSAIMKLSKAENVRKDTAMMMQPYANWEEFLMPGPTAIAILGELIFISAADDFPINKNNPDKTYEFIKYPESFRACLMQVSNQGWMAFNKAHKNMDQIRLESLNIPRYIKFLVQTLMEDNEMIVKALLPGQLNTIKTVADKCLKLANSVDEEFLTVVELIQELMEVSISARSVHEENVKEVKKALEEAKIKEVSAKRAHELAEKHFTKMSSSLDEAQASYRAQMLISTPSVLNMGAAALVDGVSNVLSSASDFLGGINQMLKKKISGKENDGDHSTDMPKGSTNSSDISEGMSSESLEPVINIGAQNNIYCKADELINITLKLKEFISPGESIDMTKLFDQRTESSNSNVCKQRFRTLETEIENEENCKAKKPALKLCKQGVKLCCELEEITKLQSKDGKGNKELATEINKLYQQIITFTSACKKSQNETPFPAVPPNLAKTNTNSGILQTIINDAHFKIELNRSQLNQAKEDYERSMENMKKCNEEHDEILIKIRNCEVQEIDFDTTVKMLVKGLKLLGNVKEQWAKMIGFFQMISNIIDSSLNTSLGQLVTNIEPGHSVTGYTQNKFVKDMIYNHAFQASNVANLVNMISGTYVEVSRNHLMDRVSSLGKLMSMDPTESNFHLERQMFQKGCDEAKHAIRGIVEKNMNDFKLSVEERINTIDNNLKAVLPPIAEEEIKAIRSSVNVDPEDVFKELSLEDADQFC